MLEEKSPDEINDAITEVIKLFAVRGRWKLIGSNSLRSTQYGVDYDVETHLSNNPALSLQHAYHEAKRNPDLYVIELKCGIDPRLYYDGDFSRHSLETYLKHPLIPEGARNEILALGDKDEEKRVELVRDLFILRWTAEDVAEGRIQLIDGTYRTLHDCLMDKSVAKVDLIVKVGNQFAEISENYYIRAVKEKNYDDDLSKSAKEKSLQEDIHYYSKTDCFKALKRIFSLYQMEGGHAKEMERLVDFFNGQVGFLYKIKCELGTLLNLLENTFREVLWEDVRNNLQFIKEQISRVYEIPLRNNDLFQRIDDCTPESCYQIIKTLKDYFSKKIMQESKDFLRTFIYLK